MDFTKMQGCGNDFVLIDGFKNKHDISAPLVKSICHRRFGVGADGLIVALPSEKADLRMQFFNPDGSEAEMCGNGIRCFARFVKKRNITDKDALSVETLAGIIKTEITGENVRVDMGEPRLDGARIPVNVPKSTVINQDIWVEQKHFRMTCVSMGNPHCVIFVPEITDELVLQWGPQIEKHGMFPKKTNVEFVEVINSKELKMRVWERGAGETLACGTGACATAIAASLIKAADRSSTVHLLGGDLHIEWSEQNNRVYMTGPAQFVFEGNWPL